MQPKNSSSLQYTPGPVPQQWDPAYFANELRNIQNALALVAAGHLDSTAASPKRLREGDLRFADGTAWNPGSGKGFYGYMNSLWVYLCLQLTDIAQVFSNAAPNVTVPVAGIQAVQAGFSNVHLLLEPSGTGGVFSQIPTVTPGAYSISFGRGNTNAGANSVNLGSSNVASASNSANLGSSNVASASAISSTNVGNYNAITAKASTCVGSQNSIDGGGFGTVVGCFNAIAVGSGTTAIGYYNQSLGTNCLIGGVFNGSTGTGSTCIGYYNQELADYSFMTGSGGINTTHGKLSIGCANNVTDAGTLSVQSGIYTASAITTTASVKVTSSQDSPGIVTAANHLVIPLFSAVAFVGTIVARQTGTALMGGWKVEGILSCGATPGSTAVTATITAIAGTTPSFTTPAITADTVYGGMHITCPATTVSTTWVAQLMTSETQVYS